MAVLLQVLLLLAVPAAALLAARRLAWVRRMGPVVLCYAAGVILGNLLPGPMDGAPPLHVSEGAIALAIPLVLFGLDLRAWLKMAGQVVLSFLLCVGAVLVAAAVGAWLFAGRIEGTPALAGMLVGVYTGGTPNMAAIGRALSVPPETFVLVNGADLLLGAAYLFFLLSAGARVLGAFLPMRRLGSDDMKANALDVPAEPVESRSVGRYLPPLLLAAGVAGFAALIGSLFPEGAQATGSVLVLTTTALGLSLLPAIRRLDGAAEAGEFFLLLFCTAMGSLARAETLLAGGATLLGFVAFVLVGAVLLHLLAARLFDLDRDTVIVTSTAAIFGPAFVPPVAAALGNRQAALSGIAMGLFGYALGNYLGLGLFWVLS